MDNLGDRPSNLPANLQNWPKLVVPVEKLQNVPPSVVNVSSIDIKKPRKPSNCRSIPSTTGTQPPNAPSSSQTTLSQTPRIDSETNDLMSNSTIANFISQVAANISKSLMDRAIAKFTNGGSNPDHVSSLVEISDLVSTLSILAANLNESIKNMIAIYQPDQMDARTNALMSLLSSTSTVEKENAPSSREVSDEERRRTVNSAQTTTKGQIVRKK